MGIKEKDVISKNPFSNSRHVVTDGDHDDDDSIWRHFFLYVPYVSRLISLITQVKNCLFNSDNMSDQKQPQKQQKQQQDEQQKPHSTSILSLLKKHNDIPSSWKNSPKARSVFSMAMASALHFSGYEFARAGTLTLLTSEKAGFSHSSVVPFALGCVSPFSLLLLWVS